MDPFSLIPVSIKQETAPLFWKTDLSMDSKSLFTCQVASDLKAKEFVKGPLDLT